MTMSSIIPRSTKLHPAAYGCVLGILVFVGRLPELFTFVAPFQLGKIALLLSFAGFYISKPGHKNFEPSVLSTTTGRITMLFVLFGAISISFSVWVGYSIHFFKSTFITHIIFFYIIARSTTNLKTLKLYLHTLFASGFILALLTVMTKATERTSVSDSYDPNDLAKLLVTIIPITILLGFVSKGLLRYLYLGVSATFIVAILFTGSRGGLLGLGATIAIIFFSGIPTPSGKLKSFIGIKSTVAAAIFFGFGLVITLVPADSVKNLSSLGSVEEDYNLDPENDTGRIKIWTRAIKAINDKPYGFGLQSANTVDGNYGGKFMTSHNSLIQVATELGVIGFILYFCWYLVAWRKVSRCTEIIYKRKSTQKGTLLIIPCLLLIASIPFIGYFIFFLCLFTFFILGPIFLTLIDSNKAYETNQFENDHVFLGTIFMSFKIALIGHFVSCFFLSAAYHSIWFLLLALITATYYLYFSERKTNSKKFVNDHNFKNGNL